MITIRFQTELEITTSVKVGRTSSTKVEEVAQFERVVMYPEVPRVGEFVRIGISEPGADFYDFEIQSVIWDLINREVVVELNPLTVSQEESKEWIQFCTDSELKLVSIGPPEESAESEPG